MHILQGKLTSSACKLAEGSLRTLKTLCILERRTRPQHKFPVSMCGSFWLWRTQAAVKALLKECPQIAELEPSCILSRLVRLKVDTASFKHLETLNRCHRHLPLSN